MPSREASLRNLEKAREAWSHPPRPWRNYKEARVIKQLVWQWFNDREPGKWSGRAVARWLGVSHTYVQRLVQEFRADPDMMWRIEATRGVVTLDHLEHARELTQRDRERGGLRLPRRWKLAECKIGNNSIRVAVPTKAEERRRAARASGRAPGPTYVPFHELPLWAIGKPNYSPQSLWDSFAALKRATEENRSARFRRVRFARR
jgi:hypothetical protein